MSHRHIDSFAFGSQPGGAARSAPLPPLAVCLARSWRGRCTPCVVPAPRWRSAPSARESEGLPAAVSPRSLQGGLRRPPEGTWAARSTRGRARSTDASRGGRRDSPALRGGTSGDASTEATCAARNDRISASDAETAERRRHCSWGALSDDGDGRTNSARGRTAADTSLSYIAERDDRHLEEPTLVVEKQRQKHSDLHVTHRPLHHLVEAPLVHHRQEGPVEGTADGEADGGDDVGEERPLLLQLRSRTRISLGGVEAEIRKQNDVDSQDDSLQKRTVSERTDANNDYNSGSFIIRMQTSSNDIVRSTELYWVTFKQLWTNSKGMRGLDRLRRQYKSVFQTRTLSSQLEITPSSLSWNELVWFEKYV